MISRAKAGILVGSLGVLLGLGVAWWGVGGRSPSSAPSPASVPPQGGAAIANHGILAATVALAEAQATATMPVARLSATITLPAEARVGVTVPFSGTVERVMVVTGQQVAAGQPLAVIRSRDAVSIGSALAQAQARLGLAEANARRTQHLVREGLVAGARADETQAMLAQVRSEVSEHRRLLSLSGATADGAIVLRAPIAGRLTSVSVSVGGPVDGMTAPFVVERTGITQLDLQVPERMASRVRTGQSVVVRQGEIRVKGQLIAVGASLDPHTRALGATAQLTGGDRLIPGRVVDATLWAPAPAGSVTIPVSALTRIDDQEVVFVRAGDHFRARTILLGGRDDDQAVVISGLQPGEKVARENVAELKAATEAAKDAQTPADGKD